MRYRDFKQSGKRSVQCIARKIVQIHEWPPMSEEDKKWLISKSKSRDLMGKLSRGASRVNHRAIALTDDQMLTDASYCAKAWCILSDIQDRLRR